ncbi:lipoyl(octanoyl) transferase LipB [Desulfonatronovibrio magnus]|uniref:lipoyl(octanoyl) transferase LipB n=1 Tax=Desulfonatronovibrio magnus TaxID=698827 RepID=UPI0005EB67A0|nr:lipoyl(octanoyl) transferase LipB [Desulfonatronovibrio magnus]
MKYIDLGLISYDQALKLQLQAVDEVRTTGKSIVFFLEHPPVITMGRNSSLNHLLIEKKRLHALGVELIKSSRGGDITCHFPGQLVVYPVTPLPKIAGGIRCFFHSLEHAVINTLKKYDITSFRQPDHSGVFTDRGKIASIGIGVKRWVSYHGLALNVCSDLKLFDLINPCGHKGQQMTSIGLELRANKPDMQMIKRDMYLEMKKITVSCS